jgi:hypothetical protein
MLAHEQGRFYEFCGVYALVACPYVVTNAAQIIRGKVSSLIVRNINGDNDQ